ncbi:S-methyl-5'-thioinosine phosphorylase [Nitrococcus mobilis]|uniref:Probable S-methyl-5'-thioinosine phosphorylase n=1 Tax=Nitrococcus mobilis Nb-231 TaxID=314278 RepID=A4BUM7_9GAMM|nr:S-methyl-5'-thioinosine phosphorylase [Nitrococcus mobilis]EAR20593.1 5'-methylthioadenosine phosphorylase [Nitrococcus mobilis Nb-231]
MTLAIIGGTGLTSLNGLEIERREMVHTPYGEPSGPITHGVLDGKPVMFLARHGYGHTIPPHKVNYRANIWALKHLNANWILAVAAVGGIAEDLSPGRLVFPDQIIDYTWYRDHTFFGENLSQVVHIDFTQPYDRGLRALLIESARAAGIDAVEQGTYGATQGPRLETAAEISRMARDGCSMVGMTGMPEVALARELELPYATCAVVANWAAGLHGQTVVAMSEIESTLRTGMTQVRKLLTELIHRL